MLLKNKAINTVVDTVSAGDFSLPQHRAMFEGMVGLWEENQAIDFVTLGEFLNRTGKLDQVGGYAYISTICDGIPSAGNVEHYAKIVKEKSILRQVIYATEAIQGLAADAQTDASKLAAQAVDMFSSLANWDTQSERSSRKKAAMDRVRNLDITQDSKIVSGLPRLDEVLGGFLGGEVVILTAETGAGKSFFALQVARLACLAGQHGLYCSGEMKAAHLMGREIAGATGISSSKLRRPSLLTPEENRELARAAYAECPQCMILDGELTLPSIRSASRAMGKEMKYLIVDYDELVEVQGAKDEWEAQKKIVRGMKSLSTELDAPSFLVSQLRKTLSKEERQTPTLQRLYGSGAKMKHASIILYIDRPWVVDLSGEETDARFVIMKSRDSRMGEVKAKFNIQTLRFEQDDTPEEEMSMFPEQRGGKARRARKSGRSEE